MNVRYLASVAALALSACGQPMDGGNRDGANGTAGTQPAATRSAVDSSSSSNVTSSVQTQNSSSVTSSTQTGGATSNTSSVVTGSDSSCSAELNGKRCDITCRAPQVAQCSNSASRAGPSCRCAN